MQLPRRTNAQVTGNVAIEILTSTLNRFANVISIPDEKDLGIDLTCELMESNNPTGIPFLVQCKGTEKTNENGRDFFSIPIKVSTINYWLVNRAPVILILVDIERKRFFWVYPYEQIKNRISEIQNNQTVNIKISKENYFIFEEKNIPKEMDRIIKDYDYKEIDMKFKEMEHGVSLEVGDIYDLYKEFKELKEYEKLRLRNVDMQFYKYVYNVRTQFNHFFVTSDIRVWRGTSDQLCFFLFKTTDKGKCYYIADVIIYKDNNQLEHIIELTNKTWLDTSGDVLEVFEPIIRHLNKIY